MKEQGRKITDVLTLLVFTVFALCVLLVLLTGAGVYRRTVARGEAGFAERTAVQYLRTRVRQAESVTAEDFGGCPALVMPETVGRERYLTRVYCYEGYMWELYSTEHAQLQPGDGEKILEAGYLTASVTDGLLTLQIDGKTVYLSLDGKEAAP